MLSFTEEVQARVARALDVPVERVVQIWTPKVITIIAAETRAADEVAEFIVADYHKRFRPHLDEAPGL